jgi:HAD superfamily hydrolase (TIGR01484 family)
MKKQYKALMLDLDGTTVPNRRDGLPSQRVKNAISEANKSIHVGVVTGRPFYYAKEIMHSLSLTGPSIVNGGAMVINSTTDTVIWEKLIAENEFSKITKLVMKYDVKMLVQSKDTEGKDIVYDASSGIKSVWTITLPDLQPAQAHIIYEELLSQFTDIAVYKIVGWNKGTQWLQISHIEATKQHGIMEVAKILGIETHEIIGVGDGYNDFPLLMACGLKVAMGNAVPELKAIADYIAPTVDEDGVADVIEKFIL